MFQEGCTALMICAMRGDMTTTKRLASSGANILLEDNVSNIINIYTGWVKRPENVLKPLQQFIKILHKCNVSNIINIQGG